METCSIVSSDCSYYNMDMPQQKCSKVKVALAAITAIFSFLLWSSYAMPYQQQVALHSGVATHHRTLPPLAAAKAYTVGDKVFYADSWDEAEHLAEKALFKEEMERRKQADLYIIDLYTDNWDGDVYKGPEFNIMTVLILLMVGVPVFGLLFAYLSYGSLWGVTEF